MAERRADMEALRAVTEENHVIMEENRVLRATIEAMKKGVDQSVTPLRSALTS
jgi:hypothetical protein